MKTLTTTATTSFSKTAATTAILAAIALTACNPSSNNDGKGTVTLDISSSQSTRMLSRAAIGGIPVTDTAGANVGTINLTAAWVVIKEIEFEHEDDLETADDDINKVEFIGPFAVDLLTGTSFPAFPQVSIDTGVYDDVEFDIEKLQTNDLVGMGDLPTEVSSNLLDYSMYLEGTYSSADLSTYVSIPFTLSDDLTEEFELSGTALSNGFVVDDNGINDILVAFRLNEWFRFDDIETNSDSAEFEDAVALDGASITLDGNTNSPIMDIIEDNIKESAEYGEDDNDDGELDDDEDDNED